jgi:hypothetical protein
LPAHMPLTYAPIAELPVTVGDDEDVRSSDSEDESDSEMVLAPRPLETCAVVPKVTGRRWGPICSQHELAAIDDLWGETVPHRAQHDTASNFEAAELGSVGILGQLPGAGSQIGDLASHLDMCQEKADLAAEAIDYDSARTVSDESVSVASADTAAAQPSDRCADCKKTVTKNWYTCAPSGLRPAPAARPRNCMVIVAVCVWTQPF